MQRSIRWDIYEEHLESAAFLWTQWEGALISPRYTLEEVASGVEERLLAHLDGLLLGGAPVAEQLLRPVLEDEAAEPDALWVASFCHLASEEPGAEALVLGTLAARTPEGRAAIGRALELSSRPGLEAAVRPLLGEADGRAAVALRVLRSRGEAPDEAFDLIGSPEPEVAIAALAMVGPNPVLHARQLLERALESTDPAVRGAALEAGLRARLRLAWEVAVRAVDRGGAPAEALLALAQGGDADHVGGVAAALEQPDSRLAALTALGFSGRIAAADACLAWLGDKDAGPLAAEAFLETTGAPLKALAIPPEEDEGAPEGEAPAAPVPVGPELDLPRLDAQKTAEWWEANRAGLKGAQRFHRGKPWSAAALSAALREGPTRRRRAHALELAIRTELPPARTSDWARAQLASPPSTARFEDRPFGDLCRR